MAERDYFSHESPDGETRSDRYERFGYNCRVSTGSGTYLKGGENNGRLEYSGWELSEEEIASEIVAGWLESTGHRENLLRKHWQGEGIGVAVGGDDSEIYVTQNFC